MFHLSHKFVNTVQETTVSKGTEMYSYGTKEDQT